MVRIWPSVGLPLLLPLPLPLPLLLPLLALLERDRLDGAFEDREEDVAISGGGGGGIAIAVDVVESDVVISGASLKASFE